jgi:hypothetical protein
MKYIKFKSNKQSGQAMLISVVFFLIISISIIAGLVSPSVREFKLAADSLRSRQSFFLAESGVEDALYRIANNGTLPASGTPISISLNGATASTTITDTTYNTKTIASTGDFSLRQRQSELKITSGDGATFRYGTQVGQGGIIFENNAFLTGNLYSNGNITGANGAYITGDVYVAGTSGSINNMCLGGKISNGNCANASASPNAHSHSITSSNIVGTAYCKTGSGNNKACTTTEDEPAVIDLPISDAQITSWKNDAIANPNNIINGNYTISTDQTIGPMKVVGDLTISGTPTITITDTVWVTGKILFSGNNGTVIKLSSSFGSHSGIMIADGYIDVGNNTAFQDSGTLGSYLMLLSTSTCDESNAASPCLSHNAIKINNNANIVIANAQNGTISFANNATVKEVVGKTIRLKQNVGISYGTGIINVGFTSGPSGSWAINSWQEK